MKILMVNKYHYVRGGAERYAFELGRLLETHGHQVIPFSTADERNLSVAGEGVFLPGAEFDRRVGPIDGLRLGARVIYSRMARHAMRRALDEHRPDVVHLHNIAHHFSPSILLELGRHGVPAVQTLHDFKLVCPTYRLLSGGEICERCAGGRYYHAALTRCNRGSLARSAAAMAESYLHAWLGSYARVNRFLCPSRFLLDKVQSFGIDAGRLEHRPLFIDLEGMPAAPRPGPYVAFVGRLSPEKGIYTLLDAARRLPAVELRIIGDGPEQAAMAAQIAADRLDHVRLVGRLDGEALREMWRGAALTVVPSEWYENFPLTVVESMALGKPVIASRLGGLSEMVDAGRTGLLVAPGQAGELATAISSLLDDPAGLEAMGQAARAGVEQQLTPETHYEAIIAAYAAVGARAAGCP